MATVAAGLIGEAGHLFWEMARLFAWRLSKTITKGTGTFVVVFAIMDNVEFR